MQALQEISSVPVSFELIDGDAKGFYHLEDKKIVVQDGMSEVQTISRHCFTKWHTRNCMTRIMCGGKRHFQGMGKNLRLRVLHM